MCVVSSRQSARPVTDDDASYRKACLTAANFFFTFVLQVKLKQPITPTFLKSLGAVRLHQGLCSGRLMKHNNVRLESSCCPWRCHDRSGGIAFDGEEAFSAPENTTKKETRRKDKTRCRLIGVGALSPLIFEHGSPSLGRLYPRFDPSTPVRLYIDYPVKSPGASRGESK